MAQRHVLDALGDPCVILLHQPHLAQVVFAVGIKTRADENQLWFVRLQARHPQHVHQLADVHAPGVGGHR